MLARRYRLTLGIKPFFTDTAYSPLFVLRTAKNDLSYSRFGFIVSKKVNKRAVARNEIKRRFRACIESLRPNIKSGYDMLFLLKKAAEDMSYKELEKNISEVLQKKGFL